ncbi:type II toxin-antitoxin system RelE/ParE family toxin [Deinococcus frigens]
MRVGEYRIVFDVDAQQKTVTILKIGHRSDIYR